MIKSKRKMLLAFSVFLAIFFSACLQFSGNQNNAEKIAALESFASCLTDKGVVMYGTFWCPKCAEQKKMFGKAFEKINYVECDPRGKDANPELCLDKNIRGYPTWEFPDGKVFRGVMSLEQISLYSGCDLNLNK